MGMVGVSFFMPVANCRLQQATAGILGYRAVCLIIFALALIGKSVRYNIEGKKPSIIKRLPFLLVGTARLPGLIYRQVGLNY